MDLNSLVNSLLGSFLLGFGAWFATGIDDVAVILSFMRVGRSGGRRFAEIVVTIGTTVGVSVMLLSCALINVGVGSTDSLTGWMRFLGMIPVAIGVKGFVDLLGRKKTVDPGESLGSLFGASCIVYIGNSSDDIAVNVTLMQGFDRVSHDSLFLGGVLAGALMSCAGVAWALRLGESWIRGLRIDKRTLNAVLSSVVHGVLVVVGLVVLFRPFE